MTSEDIHEVAVSMQLCAGQPDRVKAVVHGLRQSFNMMIYSTDQMQVISLMHLSLATNAFIADNECVYR